MKNRKIAALILSVMMVMCSMPSFVFAQENAPAEMQGAPAVAEEAPADEAAAADEAVGSDDAQEKSTKAKGPQETVKEESGEKVKAESIDGAGKEGEEKAEPEEKKPAFSDSKTVDGVKVTVSAEEGAFPEGAKLVVSDVNASEEKKVDSAVDKVRDGDANVALSYVFDIHVEDKDGKEIQPADGRDVKVSFETEEVADSNLTTDVYHVTDKGGTLKADALDVKTDGDTASASTDGFSYYTVEFTYGDLQYSMEGDTEVALSTILEKIGLTGTVTKAVSSNPDLFSVEKKGSEWKVTARQAFCSEETLSLTIDGIDYVVKVTDSQHDHPSGSHGESGTWSPWSDSANLPTASGNYYLNTDVTRSRPQIPKSGTATIKLCLNGHKITLSGGNNGLYDTDSSRKVNLTIYDSDDNSGIITNTSTYGSVIRIKGDGSTYTLAGGKITNCNCSSWNTPVYVDGGTFTMKGGMICNNTLTDYAPVYVASGTFNMSGGTITGNTNKKASGVVASGVHVTSGTFNMSGGSITNNNSPDANSAVGVYLQNSGLFNVKGKVTITGNTSKGKDLNVLVARNKTIGINGNLDSDSRIGVTTATAPSGSTTIQFTNGLSGKGSKTNFISDNSDYTVMIKNNEAHLNAHKHEFNYSVDNDKPDTIIATCVNTITDCSLEDHKATLKIVAPALKVYGGSGSEKATLEGEIPGVTPPTIVYKKDGQTLSAAPKNAGSYTAEITLTGSDTLDATASVDYTIEKADISPVVNIEGWNYGDTPKSPSVTAASNPGSGAVSYKYYTDEACTKETSTAQGATEAGGVPKKGGDYWVKATVAATDNYKSGTGTKKFTIATKAITVTGLKYDSKVYDGNTAATLDISDAELVGVQSGDDVHIKSATGTFDNKNVGTGKSIGSIVIELKGDDAGGYSATADPTTITGAITKRPIVVSGITAEDKVYDGTTDATVDASKAEFDGVISGDKLTITATGKFSNADVGEGKTVHLTLGALGGDNAGNYMLHHAHGEVTTTASITAKPMTVTVDGYENKYDGDPHSINVEVTDPADGYTVTYRGPKDTEYSDTNPGFTDPGEYVVSYKVAANNYETATGTATVKIIGKDFEEIIGSNYDDVYDKAAHGITVTVPDEYKPYKVTYSTSEDGTYSEDPIEYTNFTDGAKTVYYKVSKTGYNDFTGSNTVNITKKSVTVSGITAKDKTYDGKTTAELVTKNASFAGIISGDELTVSTTGTFEDKTAEENKTVTFGTLKLGGKDADNYELAASGNQESTTATISKKEITVSGIKSYGKKFDNTTAATSTLNYEDAILAGKEDGDGEYCDDKLGVTATGTFESSEVGQDKTINLTDLTLTGSEVGNYKLAETGQQTECSGSITQYAVTVTANPQTKVYGDADPELTYTHGEIAAGDYLEGALSRHAGEDVGQHMITVGTLHDHNKDYNITYEHAYLTITRATTNNVTASIEGWTYGDAPKTPSATATFGADTAEFTYSKTAEGEYTETVPTEAGTWYVKATVPGTKNYVEGISQPKQFSIAKKEVGLEWTDTEFTYDGAAHKPKATATDLVGKDECTVTVEGEQTDANAKTGTNNYTATAATLSNDNYKLPDNKTTTFTIAQKEITVSGIKAKDKIYDGEKDADLIFSDAVLDGKVGDDDVSVTATGTFDNKNAGTKKTVTISDLTLTGALKDNYVLAKKGQQKDTTADIEKKDIAVDADPKHKAFGEKDPELTYDADDLVEGDKFTGKLEREEGEDAGRYEIRQGTLTAGDNYTIIYDPADFTIRQADNSVTAEIEGWTYGGDPNAPSATADFGQDKAAFTYSDKKDGDYTGTVPTDAGKYYVKATIAETNNYKGAVSAPVEFTIAKKEVGLDWSGTELTYNGKAQKPKAVATGLVGEDKCDVTVDGEQTDANVKSGKDYYEAEAKALSNDNYKLPENVKAKFTIAPKELTQAMISLDSDTIKHDGTKKGPEVTMTDEDIMVKDEDYILSGDLSSSELGTHVITAEGKGNYSGSIETSWVMYSKKSNEQKEEGTGGRGDFEVFVDIENNNSTLTVDNLTIDLAKRFLTEEDMARYMEGEDVLVYMIVKEQPKSETGAGDRYILGQLFRGEGATDISWYDITVWKKIGNSPAVQVHDTVKELSMSVEVPDGQKKAPEGYTREFYLGRSHDGASKLLAQTSEVKVGFGSSKFSTYALAYKDTEKPKDDPGKGGNGGNGKGGSSKGGTKTGDPNDFAGLIALMLASGGALGAMGYRRRRENQR